MAPSVPRSGARVEAIHRNAVSSLFIEAGFNIFLPVFDEGIDFIAPREADGRLLLIQLKGRLTFCHQI